MSYSIARELVTAALPAEARSIIGSADSSRFPRFPYLLLLASELGTDKKLLGKAHRIDTISGQIPDGRLQSTVTIDFIKRVTSGGDLTDNELNANAELREYRQRELEGVPGIHLFSTNVIEALPHDVRRFEAAHMLGLISTGMDIRLLPEEADTPDANITIVHRHQWPDQQAVYSEVNPIGLGPDDVIDRMYAAQQEFHDPGSAAAVTSYSLLHSLSRQALSRQDTLDYLSFAADKPL